MQAKRLYEFGPFQLDTAERMLLRDGEVVPLTPKLFDILTLFVEKSGHLLEREDLLKAVWADSFVEEANLTVCISALRKTLGKQSNGHQYIETVPKRGYRFVADVRAFKDEELIFRELTGSNASIEREKEVTREDEGGTEIEAYQIAPANEWGERRVGLRILAACVVLVGLIAGAMYWWKYGEAKQKNTGSSVKSIAVLPFKPLIAGEGDEFLGLGIADVLITRLGSLNQITVSPPSAVFKYMGQEQDFAAAGRDLKVESVLGGSIQRSSERIRVTATLMRVQDSRLIWAETFDGKLTDIFAVQDAMSQRLAGALALNMTADERRPLTKHYTESTEAHQAYTKGRYFWNKRTGEGLKKGIEYFEQAIEKDPRYGLAYSGLADSYALLAEYGVVAPQEAFAKMKLAATRAVEIDDQLAEAHTSLAYAKRLSDWDWSGAEQEFKRATELNDSYATAHHWYSEHLAGIGRFDEALAEAKRAEELDPGSLIISTNLGWVLYLARRYDEAIEEFKKTLEMDPGFILAQQLLWQTYVKKGMYDEALAGKEMKGSQETRERDETLRKAYDVSGWKGFRRKELELETERSKVAGVRGYALAVVYTEIGDNDSAIRALEKAYDNREINMVWVKVDPFLDGLRSDPRFTDLLRRMRLES
jgi:DNA-binding winged helix-turn-helix (wHTH) protein/TolB-like protein